MKIKEILKRQLEKIKLSEKELKDIKEKSDNFVNDLREEIKKKKIKAEVFVGGSLAKGTILKRGSHDIDVFVRFDSKYKDEEISGLLGGAIKKFRGKKIHGSRDYFQVRKGEIVFEIVPVIKILKPEHARNVTDLSFFHVNYIKNQIKKKKKLDDEIVLGKSFCYANKVYGAESYIRGFSGYGLELLISYYKSFPGFLREMVRNKVCIIIDPEKYYKNKQELLNEINESKLNSPVIFIDPTFKERNALAALSLDSFEKFRERAREFLKNPSEKFFEEKDINEKNYNLIIKIKTNKQEGDIAGSKLIKFYRFFGDNLKKYFDIRKEEFNYKGGKTAFIYLKIKKKKEMILLGPMVVSVDNLNRFKKKHKNVFIKSHRAYAREKSASIRKFLNDFKKKYRRVMKEMAITGFKAVKS